MGTVVGTGISHHRQPGRAAQEAVNQALQQANMTKPDLVWVFAAVGYDQAKLIQQIREATDYCPLVGCSGQGVITQGMVNDSNFGVGVMVIQSDELRFQAQVVSRQDRSFEQLGEALGQQLQENWPIDPIALFMLTDGLTLNFDRLLSGLRNSLAMPPALPILGGAAGSGAAMDMTYQYCNDEVISDGVVAIVMSGRGQVAWAMSHGCEPIGVEYKVTRAAHNMIYELDGKPVFDVLREYLTEEEIDRWDATIVSCCFGMKQAGSDDFMIRYLPQKDESIGAVMIQTEITTGTSLWVMRRDPEKICAGTDRVAGAINRQLNGQSPKFILQFDCYGRGRSVLGEVQSQQLVRQLQQSVGPKLPWLGLYTNGEIAPVKQGQAFHNYTLVLVAVY